MSRSHRFVEPTTKTCARGCTARNRHATECEAQHTDECDGCQPREVAPGSVLCRGCVRWVEKNLAEMVALHDDLLARLAVLWHGSGHEERVQLAIAENPLPLNPTVADHREQMRRVMASWAQMVAEESGLVGPVTPALPVVAPWLVARLDWCCAQMWADEYVVEVGELASRARALIAANPRRRFVVGPCPEIQRGPMPGTPPGESAMEIQWPCPGTLSASLARQDDLLPSQIECDFHPLHTWTADRWLALGRKIHGASGIHADGVTAITTRLRERPA